MFRRVNRNEIVQTSPYFKEEGRHQQFLWMAYADYEEVEEGEGLAYLRPCTDYAYAYFPFRDTPDMFREFALIAERSNSEKLLDGWLRKHGLLGLTDGVSRSLTEFGRPWRVNAEEYPHVVSPPVRYFWMGGPGETVPALWNEVEEANEALTLYEAALSGDEDILERTFLKVRMGPEHLKDLRQRYQRDKSKVSAQWVDLLVDAALGRVLGKVDDSLRLFAYPHVAARGHTDGFDPNYLMAPTDLVASWQPLNLLGAMYLQFYWLITSAADKSLCRYCGHLIPHQPPLPQDGDRGRKPRSDKEFCNKQCRENHHYHTKIKPRRQKSTSD